MLQLRRDIENFKEQPEENISSNEKILKEVEGSILLKGVEIEKNEENILRERLEMMTLQIKQEMEEELLKEKSRVKILENKPNEDDDTKIKKFFKKLVLQDSIENVEQKKESDPTTESKNKEALNSAIQNLLELNEEPETYEKKLAITTEEVTASTKNNALKVETVKSLSKGRSPSVKVETLKRRKRSKKTSESKQQIVEIPFCSHNQHATGQDLAVLPALEENDSKLKNPLNTILSPDEQLGAEEILHELIEIRDSGKSEKNPVLDTMIR